MPKQLEGKAVPINKQPNWGKGAGRKPKLVRRWIKECGLGKEDARNILKNILTGYTVRGLEELRDTEKDRESVLTFTLVEEVLSAARKGDFSVTREMLEFIYGKAEQTVSVREDGRLVDLKNLLLERADESPEERERIIGELERVTGEP
jgi:hypothetical protein